MIASVPTATLLGVEGHPVRVEAHVASRGLPTFTVVGQPDAACRESRDRVRAAIESARLTFPSTRTVVNLAPTNLRKSGAGLDLAIAIALLVASKQLRPEAVSGLGFVAELGLDGALRPVNGVLCLMDALEDVRPVVAASNLAEARLVRPDARGARSLSELLGVLRGDDSWPSPPSDGPEHLPSPSEPDLREVAGHRFGRHALEVAAAGAHHLLMVGPPGAGKTMLAERLVSLLPDLDAADAARVSRIHSVASELRVRDGLLVRPPMRAPHHTASAVALIGGGSATLRPGEVTLASCGVLFLDELGEFPAAHLDALRQPLESGRIAISRAHASAILPASFQLVGATNPCPCGQRGWGVCSCSPAQTARYLRRLSGPLLDRFDISVRIDPPSPTLLGAPVTAESSSEVRARVTAARERAKQRGVRANRELRGALLEQHAPLSPRGRDLLQQRLEEGTLTMRGAQRTRAVALTLADLRGHDGPLDAEDLMTALDLRGTGLARDAAA